MTNVKRFICLPAKRFWQAGILIFACLPVGMGFWICASAYAFPQRIISTMPSITESLFALGLQDRVVGVTLHCDYPKEAKNIEKIGGMTVNLEKVVSLKPDLIIMLSDAQPHDVWRMKSRGLPVVTINPRNIKEVMNSILYIGSVSGITYEARALVQRLNYRLLSAALRNESKIPVPVFVMVGYNPLVTSGSKTFVNDIVERSGGRNVVLERSEYPQMNFEELYRLNPQVLIVPQGLLRKEDIKNDPKLSRLTAVQNDRILWIDPDIIFRPGPRVVDAVEEISRFLEE